MKTGRARQPSARKPSTPTPSSTRRVVIPSPANENRAPLGVRVARWAILVSSVAAAVWLLRAAL